LKELLKKSLTDRCVWLVFVSLQVPALRAIFKYVPAGLLPCVPVVMVIIWLACALLLGGAAVPEKVRRLLGRGWVLVLLLVAVAVASFLVYPVADALKEVGRGSGSDDALIIAGSRLIRGMHPYGERTYLGNPISAPPGMVLLALPFSVTGLYFLFTPALVLVAAVVLRWVSGGYTAANVFVLLMMTSLCFWELLVIGSDIPAVGLLFLVSVTVLWRLWPGTRWVGAGCVILAVLCMHTRIVFAYMGIVMVIFLWGRDRAKSIRFAAYTVLAAAALHLAFFAWDPGGYTPLHLIGKGDYSLKPAMKMVAAVLCGITGLTMILRVRDSVVSWLFYAWLCLIVPLGVLGLSVLALLKYDVAGWEGANYIMLSAPLIVGAAVMRGRSGQDQPIRQAQGLRQDQHDSDKNDRTPGVYD